MTRRRLFSPQLPAAGAALALDDAARRHALVLRLREGDLLRLFDAKGAEADATVVRCDKRELVCEVGTPEQLPAPTARLRLAVCLPKASKLELIVKMATELGVHSVQLVSSERAVPKYGADAPKLDRLQRIAIEACAQSEQAFAPVLLGPAPLSEVVGGLPANTLKLACVERSHGSDPAPLAAARGVDDVWVLVGPEGGFTDGEREQLRSHAIGRLSLGPSVLRVETACVVACALLLDRMNQPP